MLKDLSRRYVLRFEQRARAISLTLPQCKALVRLERNEGVSQARLAELADVEPMTMVRILDRMEADGLLERRPDPVDRRARRLYLTRKARPLLDEIWHLSDLTRAEVFAGIAQRDREAFIDVLERIHANVCALKDPPVELAERERPAVGGVIAGSPRRSRSKR
ncbi:MAG: MarR family transcriptional regulator [Betaproteobacteria bacterium]|nr:MarR family transcriptional regulator [Betaproteobacteria bacterium]MDE2210777.1 MarR family transcriptional regulator [Betaproteobacteria bacterium]